MVFEIADDVEWPTFYRTMYPAGIFNRSFSEGVDDPYDNIVYGNARIAVLEAGDKVLKGKLFSQLPRAQIDEITQNIHKSREYIARLKKEGGDASSVNNKINRQQRFILQWESAIKDFQEKFEPLSLKLPNSEGYWTSEISSAKPSERYSILRAYLTRANHVFVFESSIELKSESDKEAHKKNFASMLARFRTRTSNEIPSERGVCIPFGFIADDGSTPTQFKQSFRYRDAPGVLYTIDIGTVTPRNLKATPLLAAAEAMIKPPAPEKEGEPVPKVIQRIGPRVVKMGGLTATQGGVVLSAPRSNGKPYDIYSVFTGYDGWLGTTVLPHVLVNMRTVNKEVATELKEGPPPFATSKERLDVLVESMRWRPTQPPMPEFLAK